MTIHSVKMSKKQYQYVSFCYNNNIWFVFCTMDFDDNRIYQPLYFLPWFPLMYIDTCTSWFNVGFITISSSNYIRVLLEQACIRTWFDNNFAKWALFWTRLRGGPPNHAAGSGLYLPVISCGIIYKMWHNIFQIIYICYFKFLVSRQDWLYTYLWQGTDLSSFRRFSKAYNQCLANNNKCSAIHVSW